MSFAPRYGTGPGEGGDGQGQVKLFAYTFADGAFPVDDDLGAVRQRGWLWEEFQFEIAIEGKRVTVDANGHRAEFVLEIGPSAIIELACEGGDFSFRTVEVSN